MLGNMCSWGNSDTAFDRPENVLKRASKQYLRLQHDTTHANACDRGAVGSCQQQHSTKGSISTLGCQNLQCKETVCCANSFCQHGSSTGQIDRSCGVRD